ncbi:AAA-like domain protein [Caballeronia temeraria]|uniref:AAA-like domain protein n=1 Tax=Caballeronia temeraria TaxID=1777137 RepID=A0A158BDU3_9BURK|nr:type IV secretory system conjugative DNA transfer family protein [Caballeronia temeraria]SAK68229.1 AAA-like domain protein [Caballeronia temeraria]
MVTRAKKAAPEKAAPAYGVEAKAHIEAVLGASGSGKSSYVKRLMERARPARLIVFDPEGEWSAFGKATSNVADVLAGFRAAGTDGACRVVFVPSPVPEIAVRQFDAVCRIAFHAERLTFIVDELKSVTTPSRSPVGWGMLTGRGRKRGIVMYGLSQRPASIDKDFLGNCNYVRSGRLTYDEDVRTVAKVLRVPQDDVASLPDLGWIRRDMATGQTDRG